MQLQPSSSGARALTGLTCRNRRILPIQGTKFGYCAASILLDYGVIGRASADSWSSSVSCPMDSNKALLVGDKFASIKYQLLSSTDFSHLNQLLSIFLAN